jgi:hypothetical protein
MCTGIELALAAAALSAAGTGASLYGKAQEGKAMNSAANAELQRQEAYQQKGRDIFQQSLAQNTQPVANTQIAKGTQDAQQQYAALNSPTNVKPDFGTGSASQNNVVNSASQAKVANAGNALAPLQGMSDWQTQQAIGNLMANSALGQNASFASSSQNVLPYELEQAQNSQSGLTGVGSLMNTAGGLLGLYGMTMPAAATGSFAPAMNNGVWASMSPFQQYSSLPGNILTSGMSTLPPF